MASEVADLWIRLRLLADGFSAGLKTATAEAEGFSERMDNIGDGLTKFAKRASLAAAGATVAVIKMAGDWQQSMIKLTTSAGEAGGALHGSLTGEIAKVSNAMLTLAVQTGTSTKSMADAMYYVESAGYHGADGLNVLRIAAEGAKAEGADTAIVADALTTVLHDMGMKASDSVPAMNMLIRAVSDGKTTMQDTSAALGNLLAASQAVGEKLPDALGAFATMTVAGDTAQRATIDLAHTLQSLQSPTALAVKWMGQMGLSTVDLKDHLGDRGLLGTITMIDEAILAKMGPDGHVLQSAFNESKTSAANLNTMLQAMPPNLRKLSQEVEQGTLTAKEYNKITGDLPANLKAQASEFLNVYKSATSFNLALRNNTADSDTFAGMLRHVLGDQIDTNTALQIGGINLAYFAQATQDVSAAGQQAGNDIETWGSITQGFNFRVDQAKEAIVTMAIRIGTTLLPRLFEMFDLFNSKVLPVLVDVKDNLTAAFNSPTMQRAEDLLMGFLRSFVTSLRETWQAVVNLWHALEPTAAILSGALLYALRAVGMIFADVVGPAVVAVTGFLKDHSGTIRVLAEIILPTLLARLIILKSLDIFTGMMNGLSAVLTMFSNFNKQVATGAVFDNIRFKAMLAAESVQNLAVEEGAAGTAAAGAATGGMGGFAGRLGSVVPLLGLAVTGVTLLSLAFDNNSGSAEKATASVDEFVAAMAKTSNAASGVSIDAGKAAEDLKVFNNAASITNETYFEGVNAGGMADAFKTLRAEVPPTMEPMAQLGVVLGKINQQFNDVGTASLKNYDAALAQMVSSGHYDRAAQLIKEVSSVTDAQGVAIVNVTRDFPQYRAEVEKMNAQLALNALGTDKTTASLAGNTDALALQAQQLGANTDATTAAADATAKLMQQQQDMTKGLEASRAIDDFTKSISTLSQSFKDNGSAIEGNSKAALANREAIRGSIQTIIDVYNSQDDVAKATGVASQKMKDQITQLINQSTNSAATRKALQSYIDTLNLIPPGKDTVVSLDTRSAEAKLAQYQKDLAAAIGSAGAGNQVMTPGHVQLHRYADGGFVTGSKGAPQLAIVHGGEYVVSLEEQAGMGSGGSGGGGYVSRGNSGPVIIVNNQGSVIAERDLRDLVQTLYLQLGGRRSASYAAYKR